MNNNSYLAKFINENKDWRTILPGAPYFITIKEEGDLAIFNYNMLGKKVEYDESIPITKWVEEQPSYPGDKSYIYGKILAPDENVYKSGAYIKDDKIIGESIPHKVFSCDFSIPMVQEARGIILNTKTKDVVCWPFRKFGNYQESYVDKIDWNTARVQDKEDGSITKLWYDKNKKDWTWSTNGIIYASEAENNRGFSFLDMIKETVNYKDINFSKLNKDNTYIFELTSPDNQIVTKYNESKLFHLGTRNNLTGQELIENIGIEKPKEYKISSLEECIKAVEALNPKGASKVEREGFVVVDGNWNRIKVKSPEYILLHHLISNENHITSRKEMILLLLDNEFNLDLEELKDKSDVIKESMEYYQEQIIKVFEETEKTMLYARALYEEYDGDLKAVAKELKGKPYSNAGFQAIKNPNLTAFDFWTYSDFHKSRLMKSIPRKENKREQEQRQEENQELKNIKQWEPKEKKEKRKKKERNMELNLEER